MRYLKKLLAANNKLVAFPELVDNAKLELLDLQQNQLSALPKSIGYCTGLKMLYLGKNLLEELPATCAMLAHLETLDISHNKFKAIPLLVGSMRSLMLLAVRGNDITELPSVLTQLRNTLVAMDMNEALIVNPPPEVVSQGLPAIFDFLFALNDNPTPSYRPALRTCRRALPHRLAAARSSSSSATPTSEKHRSFGRSRPTGTCSIPTRSYLPGEPTVRRPLPVFG